MNSPQMNRCAPGHNLDVSCWPPSLDQRSNWIDRINQLDRIDPTIRLDPTGRDREVSEAGLRLRGLAGAGGGPGQGHRAEEAQGKLGFPVGPRGKKHARPTNGPRGKRQPLGQERGSCPVTQKGPASFFYGGSLVLRGPTKLQVFSEMGLVFSP